MRLFLGASPCSTANCGVNTFCEEYGNQALCLCINAFNKPENGTCPERTVSFACDYDEI